jgi:hypothetical protein
LNLGRKAGLTIKGILIIAASGSVFDCNGKGAEFHQRIP